jgi:hypothetical protein
MIHLKAYPIRKLLNTVFASYMCFMMTTLAICTHDDPSSSCVYTMRENINFTVMFIYYLLSIIWLFYPIKYYVWVSLFICIIVEILLIYNGIIHI